MQQIVWMTSFIWWLDKADKYFQVAKFEITAIRRGKKQTNNFSACGFYRLNKQQSLTKSKDEYSQILYRLQIIYKIGKAFRVWWKYIIARLSYGGKYAKAKFDIKMATFAPIQVTVLNEYELLLLIDHFR